MKTNEVINLLVNGDQSSKQYQQEMEIMTDFLDAATGPDSGASRLVLAFAEKVRKMEEQLAGGAPT